jgi:hypothetical protein
VLVVIVIIAVLVGLTLPALRGVRRQSRDAASVNRQRQIHAMILQYAQDASEQFPYLGTPGEPLGTVAIRGQAIAPASGASYFSTQAIYWASALFPSYCTSREALELQWGSARAIRDSVAPEAIASPIWLTHAAAAAPSLFATPEPLHTPAMFRSTRLGEVIWPSAKGLTLDVSAGLFVGPTQVAPGDGYSIGLADGSASLRPWRDAEQPVTRAYGCITWPVMATRDGWKGRDFK